MQKVNTIRMSVMMEDLGTLVDACCQAGWAIEDTGERITTEECMDGEAVVVIRVPAERRGSGSLVAAAVNR